MKYLFLLYQRKLKRNSDRQCMYNGRCKLPERSSHHDKVLTMNRKKKKKSASKRGEQAVNQVPTAMKSPGESPTSSGVSFPSGCAAAARRARFPARMLLRLICLSGGGPPRGCPRTMMAHPERTYTGN